MRAFETALIGAVLCAGLVGCGKGDLDVQNNEEGADQGLRPDSPDRRDLGTAPTPDTGGGTVATPDPDMGSEEPDMAVIDPGPVPNDGWIGGPCQSASECEYPDSVCLTSDHPGGQCSVACDRLCPDQDGMNSLTFCVGKPDGGFCVSQCDFDLYPDGGCREGYSCRIVSRYGEPGTQRAACLPGMEENPNATTACLRALDEAGVIWAPWAYTTQYADGLACTINDPIRVTSPINGITYRYYNQDTAGTMSMGCDLALALVKLGELLKEKEVTEVLHIGTFNCRKIAGSNRLSQHSFGNAIDIWGFEDNNGADYILERDWEHNTANPQGAKAKLLYEIGQEMYARKIFNIVLTPNYNSAHDNHFHVDLTPGGDFIGSSLGPEYYFGNDEAMWLEHCE